MNVQPPRGPWPARRILSLAAGITLVLWATAVMWRGYGSRVFLGYAVSTAVGFVAMTLAGRERLRRIPEIAAFVGYVALAVVVIALSGDNPTRTAPAAVGVPLGALLAIAVAHASRPPAVRGDRE